jgi:uncharacterized protein YrrD
MMRRSRDLFGKPVVCADNGEKLGTVSDLLFNDEGGQFAGLVLRRGPFKAEAVLPAEAVQTLGADAIVARSRELISPTDWRAQHAHERVHAETQNVTDAMPPSTIEPSGFETRRPQK